MSVETKLFFSNKTQAVRLPQAVAFGANVQKVVIRKKGFSRIITPANRIWDDFFEAEGIKNFPERVQPEMQKRESF